MSFRNNGSRRTPRYILSSIFLFLIGLACLYIAAQKGFPFAWILISAAVFFLSFSMFRNANEV
ncbi:MAG: hypothetical protein Q4F96_01145 [Bacillota bacterium]|nr:hypothetical protein [Bacillota bacterium]